MCKSLPDRARVFISYSHHDQRWLERLQVHLRPLERESMLERWDDTMIDPGGLWKDQIANAVNCADVAILLISPDFMASEFIAKDELPPLLDAAETRGIVILPVIISPSRFTRHPSLSRFQTVNPPHRPLWDMRPGQRDAVWDRVIVAIEKIDGKKAKTPANSIHGKFEEFGH